MKNENKSDITDRIRAVLQQSIVSTLHQLLKFTKYYVFNKQNRVNLFDSPH